MKVLFISPHMDDVVLSCCGLIKRFVDKKFKCDICNVFTCIGNEFLELSNIIKEYLSEDLLYSNCDVDMEACKKWSDIRYQEDLQACAYLQCNRMDLKYIDAIFRKSKNKYIYQNEEQLFGDVQDVDIVKKIYNTLYDICVDYDICFFPNGNGNHVDHIILNKVGQMLKVNKKINIAFYYEQPYYYFEERDSKNIYKYNLNNEFGVKVTAVNFYKSQLIGLFGNKNIINKLQDCELYLLDDMQKDSLNL